MNLSDYVDANVEPDEGSWLDGVGRATVAIHHRTGSEERTRPLVASAFWQAYINSRAFAKDLSRNRLAHKHLRAREAMIVHHTAQYGERYTLLLSSTQVREPRSFPVDASAQELRYGWDRANRRRRARVQRSRRSMIDPLRLQKTYGLSARVAIEAWKSQRFHVLVTPPVEEEVTSVPTPALGVAVLGGSEATAGVIVRDAVGRVAVTTAAHAVPPGSKVTIGGMEATVTARADDAKYDCCLIALSPFMSPPVHQPTHGPLRLAPRMNQSVGFEGIGSGGALTTLVRAFNPELPYLDPNLQQTVRTDLVTARGDSGAALVDTDDYVVGFAYSRSAASAPTTYSAWIWADAVFQKLELEAY